MKDAMVAEVNGRLLKKGYTTGTCAAAATVAAISALIGGYEPPRVSVALPSGETAYLDIFCCEKGGGFAECGVVKDGGDDPDATTGTVIRANVSLAGQGISVDGGSGVGRVTKPGLKCAVGEAAINPVPRKMICENAAREAERLGYRGGLSITISADGGEETAKKTFNPRLGIVGGISILGTTGIVEPMSEKALVDTIWTEIDARRAAGFDTALIAPGNYGRDYCRSKYGIDIDRAIKISNYIGEAIDHMALVGFKRVLLVGHAGKLVKIAAGVMNTHSSYADCRMETIAAYAAMEGASADTVRAIMGSVTTDAATEQLGGLAETVYKNIVDRIKQVIEKRARGAFSAEVIMFGGTPLAATDGAEAMIQIFKGEQENE